ncbi:4-hydroxy-tetrahydrodipicolinate synthase [Halorarum halophilum]|uniref:4-hydroxy-tetrahydrodipicolinate synthase n=1 Tax=Halorarum halophilum TaxID=2743090 RepID=A0A7D5KHR4_9EURY|nr:4-hydroxy-tetrahydrodipicolinate synthase [Halobaculum halophilum]QLG29396.1 4-hydroxy-tetrahydrodipicolinate synthase [Halobaculum halophilum]
MTIHHDTFAGVYPAMTTPFTDSDDVDHEQLAADARRLEAAGVDGLVPVGSTGESATLTHAEHGEVVETVVDAVEIPVIAGTGSNSTHEAVDLSERAAEAGADALLLISPYYNKPEPRGQYEHFAAVAEAVDLPQIVYNVPSRTGQSLDLDTVVELAALPNVQGYKAASGDIGRISEIIERTRGETFDVLSGDDALTVPTMSVGATGTISVGGNVVPERTTEMVHAALEDDFERARELHHELAPLFRELFRETNPIPVKEAMEIRGYGPADLRLPLTRATDETRAVLEDLLADLEESEVAEA